MATKIIKTCLDCPFAILDVESEQMICSEIRDQNLKWIDMVGFDEQYEENKSIPLSCPLHFSPITLSL